MSSLKDKEYHKLRNPQKYPELASEDVYGQLTKEGAEAHKRYLILWRGYGLKSMVADKRRRNKTRKSNQKNKQILHQMERAQYKTNLRAHLIDQDRPIDVVLKNGSIC